MVTMLFMMILYENVFLEQLLQLQITFRGKFVELVRSVFEGKEDSYFHLPVKILI